MTAQAKTQPPKKKTSGSSSGRHQSVLGVTAPRPFRNRRRSSKKSELLDFTILLSTMLDAGVPITTSLQSAIQDVAERTGGRNKRWLKVLTGVRDHVEAGGRLSEAFSFYPDFPDVFVHMTRAGEVSGQLSQMLDRVASFLETDGDTRGAVIGAMIYPACMFGVAVICVTFLLTFIFPKFMPIFAGHEELLPWPTKFFMGLSNLLRHDALKLVGGIVGFVVVCLYLRTLRPIRRILDGLKLDIPVVRYVVRNFILSRTLKTMGILLDSGVPILEVIRIVRDVSGNVHFAAVWDEVGETVMNGNPMTQVLQESPLFPASTVQIVLAGERTGQTGKMMVRVADRMEKELNRSIKAMTQMIEPAMIVGMGGLVGMIAASLMLPLFRMSNVVGG